jgi:hypothetical protein
MKPSALVGALGAGAKILGTASTMLAVVAGLYLVDCRRQASGMDQIDRCYLFALNSILGAGGGAGVGWLAGFNTYNPALRKEDEPRGILGRRQP